MTSTSRCKATPTQVAYLSNFMKNHPHIARGDYSQSLQSRIKVEKVWEDLAKTLNTIGGAIKTVHKWKQAWRDLRNNIKKKKALKKAENKDAAKNIENEVITPNVVINVMDKNEPVTDPLLSGDVQCIWEPKLEDIVGPSTSATQSKLPKRKISTTSSGSSDFSLLDLPEKTACMKSKSRKGLTSLLANIDSIHLEMQKEKLQLRKEKNEILRKKNRISQERNAALNRVADALQEVSETLKS